MFAPEFTPTAWLGDPFPTKQEGFVYWKLQPRVSNELFPPMLDGALVCLWVLYCRPAEPGARGDPGLHHLPALTVRLQYTGYCVHSTTTTMFMNNGSMCVCHAPNAYQCGPSIGAQRRAALAGSSVNDVSGKQIGRSAPDTWQSYDRAHTKVGSVSAPRQCRFSVGGGP